jgi:hypothetical protein
MAMDFDKWHDGTGYDLDALRQMSPAERKVIHDLLIQRGAQDWRDVEALACLDTPETHAVLKAALTSDSADVRNAVTRCVPDLISDDARTASLVKALTTAVFYGGLTQALDQVAEFHPPKIIDALIRGALNREGEIAVHFAAMLFFIHGKAEEAFDWKHRPFFLRFNTEDRAEREKVFRELCEKIEVEPTRYLPKAKPAGSSTEKQNAAPEYTVEVDCHGEMLTYVEAERSAHVICTFGDPPRIVPRTLSNWAYFKAERSGQMTAEEKQIILDRIADYCRRHLRMPHVIFES